MVDPATNNPCQHQTELLLLYLCPPYTGKSILWFGSSIPIEISSRMCRTTEKIKTANVVRTSAVVKVERECKISFIANCGSQLLFQFSLNLKCQNCAKTI